MAQVAGGGLDSFQSQFQAEQGRLSTALGLVFGVFAYASVLPLLSFAFAWILDNPSVTDAPLERPWAFPNGERSPLGSTIARKPVAREEGPITSISPSGSKIMRPHSCIVEELALVDAAKDALHLRRRPEKNTVCAGVLTSDGQTYLGLDLVSRKTSICAEPAAISHAHVSGSYGITSIAAVCFAPDLKNMVVISPCGACRELIWYHAPGARVLLPGDPAPVAVAASDLFTAGELFPQKASGLTASN